MSDFNFVESEKKTLNFWKKENVFERSLEQTKNNSPYIFYDGPPFATGLPHHGHLVASTLKDIIPRYFTMNGRYVSRRFGWDCHGLPIEHEIDKKLGLSAHQAVEKLGVKKYNQECRSIVDRYTSEWQKTIERVGRWVDFNNDYRTMDRSFMESVWWVFRQVWDKGLIYQGLKVVPYSTGLSTVLSNFEAGENYKEVQDPAVTLIFPVKGHDFSLLAWTTTPWTLPMNQALCVKADVDYVKVKHLETQKLYVLASARLEDYQKRWSLEVTETMKGRELIGLSYEPLFDYVSNYYKKNAPEQVDRIFTVVADDYVTTEDGTGIVHQAPAFGEDDYRIAQKQGLTEVFAPIDEEGQFNQDVPEFSGQYFKEADKEISKALKEKGKLFEHRVFVHSYPFCPRSETPLMYRSIPSWYLNVESIKDKMIKANNEIHWVPEHLKKGRFGQWLEGARDWAISRNRVWGTPLPIWQNETTKQFYCVGSVKELEDLSGSRVDDLHREYVDDITFQIKGEEGIYKRIPEVLDCWFESGSMPYAQLHYPFENKDIFDAGFPAEFIAEGLDQTRGWFYTLTVLASALFDKPAFKNVVVNGLVLAEDGKKMSKRLRNYTPPDDLMENYGADALRLFLINSGLVKGEELRFSDDGVKDMVRRVLLPWYNASKFFTTYAEIDQWSEQKHFKLSDHILDRWIVSKLQTLVERVNEEMQLYHLYNVVPELFSFIEDLTNWYIRLNRRRFWEGQGISNDKASAYSALFCCLNSVNKLMAPFAPFLSEELYQQSLSFFENGNLSVHLESYPQSRPELKNEALEDAVERMQQIILLGRQLRSEKKIKVKTPLSKLTIIHRDEKILGELKRLEDIIKIELNVRSVSYEPNEESYIHLYGKPNSRVLGKKLGKKFKQAMKVIGDLGRESLLELEDGKAIESDGFHFSPEDVFVYRQAREKANHSVQEIQSNRWIAISLDCKLTDELRAEGKLREIIGRVQKSRKDFGLQVQDRIDLVLYAEDKLLKVAKQFSEKIQQETLAEKIRFSSIDESKTATKQKARFDIDGDELVVAASILE